MFIFSYRKTEQLTDLLDKTGGAKPGKAKTS